MLNNTINTWTKNVEIMNHIQKINKKLRLQSAKIDGPEDLIAMPGFVNIIDGRFLTDKRIDGLNPFLKYYSKDEFIILAVGKKFVIKDIIISRFVQFIPENIDEKTLTDIIKKRMKVHVKKSKEDVFKSKLHRILFVYDALRRGVAVRTEDLVDIFNVSERTIRRDFKILGEVLDEKIDYDRDFGFFLTK